MERLRFNIFYIFVLRTFDSLMEFFEFNDEHN